MSATLTVSPSFYIASKERWGQERLGSGLCHEPDKIFYSENIIQQKVQHADIVNYSHGSDFFLGKYNISLLVHS